MVPKGWSLVEARDVCKSISVGVVIKPTQYYVPEDEGIKAFRSANVREGFINDNDWVYFSKEGHAKNKKSHLLAGDVLIVRTGYPGTACVVTPEFEGSNAIDIVIARPDSQKVVPEYLCAYTNSHIGKSQVLDLQGGMAQKHLNVGAYQVLKIRLPSLPEQKKIAQILSTWDKAITTTEQLLANSRQQKKALMQQLLTGKKRLAGYPGEFKRFHFSEILKVDAKSLGSKTPQDFEFEYISLSDVEPGRISSNLEKHVFVNAPSRARRVVKFGDILLSTVRPNLKGFARVSNRHEACIASTGFAVLTPKKDICGDYVYHYLFSAHITGQINALVVGTNYPAINSSDVSGLCIYCPSYEEQARIAEILNNCDTTVEALRQKLDALKQEKKALMQQLLTGKRRVQVSSKETAC